jgi:hypothetical protein
MVQIICNKKIVGYGGTAHNRTVYAAPAAAGLVFRSLGHSAALHSHASLHPHFCKPWKPTVSFIATAKTSYTAGTLYAMRPKSF